VSLHRQCAVFKDLLLSPPGGSAVRLWGPVADLFFGHLVRQLEAWLPILTGGSDPTATATLPFATASDSAIDCVYTLVQHLQYLLQHVLTAAPPPYSGSLALLQTCCRLLVATLSSSATHDVCAQAAGMVLAGMVVAHAETRSCRFSLRLAVLRGCGRPTDDLQARAVAPKMTTERDVDADLYQTLLPSPITQTMLPLEDTQSSRAWLCLCRGLLMFSSRSTSNILWAEDKHMPAIITGCLYGFVCECCARLVPISVLMLQCAVSIAVAAVSFCGPGLSRC